MLAQCRALVHLDLSENEIGDAGAESFAGVEEDEEDAGEIDEDEIF